MLKKNPTTKWKKLDSKEIKPVNPKGNQPWIFIGRTAAEAPIVWPLDVKSWLIWKDPDAGKDWRWEEKGMTEGPRDGWMASLTQWTWIWANPGDSEGQGSLACYSPWSRKESDTTEWLSNHNNCYLMIRRCSPQSFQCLRIDHHQPIRELCTSWSHILGRPSPTLPFKMLCWNSSGNSGF